jgi:hypothetical protein
MASASIGFACCSCSGLTFEASARVLCTAMSISILGWDSEVMSVSAACTDQLIASESVSVSVSVYGVCVVSKCMRSVCFCV